ncbi:hypothetical protein K505DRAFT_337956 [Melanomma pulvis-pyrius CBS 109.77]|uniref:Uncharacterized protein n=1 Tax=Melanomma pulvis-pyrius CBS 109.77 TaxID=1314802 RepID=A0A6A6XAT6_9PLEO|nr:hypothetical protein K505DRAFT_337956 [Melanomma pulvis-pyrius CBS 109.77]
MSRPSTDHLHLLSGCIGPHPRLEPQPRLPKIHDVLPNGSASSRVLELPISSPSLAQHSTVTVHGRAQHQQYLPPIINHVLGPSTAHGRAPPPPCPPHNDPVLGPSSLGPSSLRKARTPNETNDHILRPSTAQGRAQIRPYPPHDYVLGLSKVGKARKSNKPPKDQVMDPSKALNTRPLNKAGPDLILSPIGRPDAHIYKSLNTRNEPDAPTFQSPNSKNEADSRAFNIPIVRTETGKEKEANRDERLVIRIANLQNALLRIIPRLDERAIPQNHLPNGGWRPLTARSIDQSVSKTTHPDDVLRYNKVGIIESSTEIHEQSEVLLHKTIQRLKDLGDEHYALEIARQVGNRGCK